MASLSDAPQRPPQKQPPTAAAFALACAALGVPPVIGFIVAFGIFDAPIPLWVNVISPPVLYVALLLLAAGCASSIFAIAKRDGRRWVAAAAFFACAGTLAWVFIFIAGNP